MADLYNNLPVLGVVRIEDGRLMYNNQRVIGFRPAEDGVDFVDNQRVIGTAVQDDGATMFNSQPVVGIVQIDDGRSVFNGLLVVPLSIDVSPIDFLLPDQWSAGEAPADANTRKTRAIVDIPIQFGYLIRAYRGTNPLGVLTTAQTAPMPNVGGVYDWTSTGQAGLGETVYVRIARSLPDGSGLEWISDVKQFVASNVPSAPAFTFTPTTDGASTLTFTAPVGNGRAVTGGEYRVNGGSWITFTTLDTLELTGLSGATDEVGVRWVNANGYSGVTTQDVASGDAPVLDASDSAAGRVLTISYTATGTPTPTTTLSLLTLDGGDVSGDAVAVNGGWTYTVPSSEDAQVVAWEVSSTNTAGTATTTGDETFTADIAAPGDVPDQTAYFGASTASGAGRFRPLNADGEEVALTEIVSGGATTPAAQIVDGGLAFSGTGAPNGAEITCSHADGEVVITIATVAGAKSVHTASHIYSALFIQRSAGSPMQVLMRPGDYDVNANGAQATNGIFHAHLIPQAAATTLKRHPDQVSRPRFVKPNVTSTSKSNWLSTKWVTVDGCDFWFPDGGVQMIQSGSTGGASTRTNNITLRDCRFIGPEVPLEDLYDPTEWDQGYSGKGGKLAQGPDFGSSFSITMEDVSFENINTAGDYCTDGGLVMKNITGRNIYFDFIRVKPEEPTVPDKVSVFENIRATGFFAINNEIDNPDPEKPGTAPHNDFIQILPGDKLKYAVFRHCYCTRGPFRGNVLQVHQNNDRVDRCLYHENVGMNLGSNWGLNSEGANYLLINQCTYVGSSLNEVTSLRFGSPGNPGGSPPTPPVPAYGEMRVRKSYVGNNGGSNSVTIAVGANNQDDPAVIVNDGSYYPTSQTITDLVRGPANPVDLTAALLAARPVPGSIMDTDGIGALTVDGEWRNTEIPPMCGVAAGLSVSGSDLIITPSVSLYYDVLPTQWQYRTRLGPYTDWAEWSSPISAANVTLTGAAVNDTQVQYRWLNSAGVAGVISVEAVVTGGSTPPASEGPAISYVNSGIATVSSSATNRNITLWPTPDTADETLPHLIGVFFRQTGGASKTMGTEPLTFLDQSDALGAPLAKIATGVAVAAGSGTKIARLSLNTPEADEKGVRATFTNGGSYTSQMAAAAVKITDPYTAITTAEVYTGGDMGSAAAELTANIYLLASGRLVVFAYTNDSGTVTIDADGPSAVTFDEVGNVADGTAGRIVTLISTTDMAQGAYAITGSLLRGLQVAAVANP